MTNYGKPLMQRFDIDEKTGCWNWNAANTGAKTGESYGCVGGDTWPERKAHRLFYRLYKGGIPDHLHVLHTCDNPKCVNPDHLKLGTHGDNMREMIERGRRLSQEGVNNPAAKLTVDQVVQIKLKLNEGVTCERLGQEYGVTEAAIRAIKKGRTWRHV